MPAANTGNTLAWVMQALQGLGDMPHFQPCLTAHIPGSFRPQYPSKLQRLQAFSKGQACCRNQLNRTEGCIHAEHPFMHGCKAYHTHQLT